MQTSWFELDLPFDLVVVNLTFEILSGLYLRNANLISKSNFYNTLSNGKLAILLAKAGPAKCQKKTFCVSTRRKG